MAMTICMLNKPPLRNDFCLSVPSPGEPTKSHQAPQQIAGPPRERKNQSHRGREPKRGEGSHGRTLVRAHPRRDPTGRNLCDANRCFDPKDRKNVNRQFCRGDYERSFENQETLANQIHAKHGLQRGGVPLTKGPELFLELSSFFEPTRGTLAECFQSFPRSLIFIGSEIAGPNTDRYPIDCEAIRMPTKSPKSVSTPSSRRANFQDCV